MSLENKLIQTLKKLTESYQKLEKLAREKNDILGEQDLRRLEEITSEEEKLVEQVNGLKKERINSWQELTGLRKGQLRKKTLRELLSVLSAEAAKKVNALRGELKLVMRDLQRINQENIVFHKHRLQVYERTFNNFVSHLDNDEESGTYDQKGQADEDEKTSKSPLLIDRAV
ncbi:MAG: flagellar protein FlgN [bacterium]